MPTESPKLDPAVELVFSRIEALMATRHVLVCAREADILTDRLRKLDAFAFAVCGVEVQLPYKLLQHHLDSCTREIFDGIASGDAPWGDAGELMAAVQEASQALSAAWRAEIAPTGLS